MRAISIVVIFSMSVFAASCGKQPRAAAEKPPVVRGIRVEPVAFATIDDFYEATGTVRSRTSATLSAKVMGVVTSIRVREGDRVRAGQALLEIDNQEAAAHLQKAQAGLREAQEAHAEVERSVGVAQAGQAAAAASKRLAATTLARYQNLLDRKSVSPQEFDEVRGRYEVADAENDRAEKTLQVLAAKKSQTAARMDQARADIAAAQVRVVGGG
ncbi:MAG: efflux RND transporter periplasmic adaptor subunit, partial [Blastocatellia bacterium]